MQRVTVMLDDTFLAELDQLADARHYASRSEALRDVARAGMHQLLLDADAAPDCVATLTYVYDHGARDLAYRLAALLGDHHDLCVATTRMPLNHESSMEVVMLRGATGAVRSLAHAVLTERGVRHGHLALLPVATDEAVHAHGGGAHGHLRAR